MSTVFFMSDLHLQHVKLLSFEYERTYEAEETAEGVWITVNKPFINIDQHDQYIIDQINKTVGKDDTLWMLGDVSVGGDLTDATKERLRSIQCKRLNLVEGNHDTPKKTEFYREVFDNIVGCYEFKGDIVLSHIPVHVQQVETRFKCNIHGHLHSQNVQKKVFVTTDWDSTLVKHVPVYEEVPDPRYVNVSMEQLTNMTPISYDVIKDNLRKNGVL